MKKSPRWKSAPTLVVGAPWFCCAVAGLCWFNSSQASFQSRFEQAAGTEPRCTTVTRANLMFFRRNAPRHDLVAEVEPLGRKQSNAWNIYVAPMWKNQSPSERQRVVEQWKALYFHTVNTNPANASKPQICIRTLDGGLVARAL